jgi:hypothetical protein
VKYDYFALDRFSVCRRTQNRLGQRYVGQAPRPARMSAEHTNYAVSSQKGGYYLIAVYGNSWWELKEFRKVTA